MLPKEQSLLDELLDREEGLTGWEMDYLESLDKQRERELSPKQLEVLERIARKCGLLG